MGIFALALSLARIAAKADIYMDMFWSSFFVAFSPFAIAVNFI
jgi:hypothetical protein